MKQTRKEHWNTPRLWWICLALAAITIAVFSPLFHYDFLTFDDQVYVTENPYVRSGLNGNSLAWAFQASTSGNWLPLTWISYLLNVQFYGAKAGGFHLTNVLFHAANAVLLFLLLQRLSGAIWRSALVAALFAWHPAHVESVAWIAERKDVLCAFFGMLALLAYVRYASEAKAGGSKRKMYYVFVVVLFALGLMAKAMLVTLPFVLLLLDFWPLDRMSRNSWRKLLTEKTPLLALSAACCVTTVWAQQRNKAIASSEYLPLWHRLSHVLASYLDYIFMLLFPRHLAIYYPYPSHEQTIKVIGGAAVLLGFSALAIGWAQRRPWLAVGWFWFVGMLVPVIGLVQVGGQAVADRYTYLPGIGVFIIVIWAGAELSARYPFVKWLAPAAGAALLAATWTQIHYWKDTRTVFERAVQVTRDNFLALTLLGSTKAEAGDVYGAIALYQAALSVKPNYPEAHFFQARALEKQGKTNEARAEYELCLRSNPTFEQGHIFLGVLLAGQKQYDQAAAHYEAVLKNNPRSATAHNDLAHVLQAQGRLEESATHYLAAIQYDSSLAQAHNNLGVLDLQRGQLAEATTQLREALRLNPGNIETEYNLALALNQQQQWKEAADLLQRIAPAQPNNAGAQYQYGLALARLGKTREAMAQYARALLLNPDHAGALNELAWIAATDPQAELRNGGQAVALAERACTLTSRQQPAMLLTLAAAYAETGRFSEAAALADKSLEAANAKGDKENVEKAMRLKEIFASRKPYRETTHETH